MDSQNQPQRQALARLSLVCLAALSGGGAYGQANPYYIGASQALTHESNLFRGAGGINESDTVSVTSLLAGLDQPIGRQRLFGDAALRVGRFAENSGLNYTGGNLLAGVDWEALESLSGRLSYNIDRTLASTGLDLGVGDPRTRNMQTTQEFALRGLSSKVAPLALELGYTHRALEYSLVDANALEFKQNTASAGGLWRPGGSLTLGLALRRTDGTYPFAAAGQADDFERNDVDLSALWIASGASTLTARLSRTREKHSVLLERDVSGNTGAISWSYKPSGKINLILDYIRDTGAESTFLAGGGSAGGTVAPVVNSSPVANTWQLRGDYEVTAKVQLVAFLRQLKRELVNTATPPGTGEDTLTETRLGVNWTPLRSVLVGCSVGREKRNASDGAIANVLSTPYSSNTVRCLAQFRTQ